MPNHVSNRLTVKGPHCDIDRMKEAVGEKGSPLNEQRILPMPFELRCHPSPPKSQEIANKMSRKYGAADWYAWAIQNWGTKWGIYDAKEWSKESDPFSSRDNQIITDSIEFLTAWSPPTLVVIAISLYFPSIEFILSSFDEGYQFARVIKLKNGEITEKANFTDIHAPQFQIIGESFGFTFENEKAEK